MSGLCNTPQGAINPPFVSREAIYIEMENTTPSTISYDAYIERSDLPTNIDVNTPYGPLTISTMGYRGYPAIVTYHDVGLNSDTTFRPFLNDPSASPLSTQFRWYHINAPGQIRHVAEKLPPDYVYPTMTQLAEMVEYVVDHFQLGYFIAMGVGAGANILARYAILNPERISGLVLINLNPQSMSWTNLSSFTGKAASWQLKGRDNGIPRLASQFLIRQAFGPSSTEIHDVDLVRAYTENLRFQIPHNLGLFLDSYCKRSSITGDFMQHVKCKCLFVVSSNFEQKDQVVKLCSSMDPKKTTFLEISNSSGPLLDDHPAKMAVALKLFVQGLGLVPSLSLPSELSPRPSYNVTPDDSELSIRGTAARLHECEAY